MVKIEDIRERLVSDPPDLPSWVYFDPASTPSVVSALDYWLEAAPKKTAKDMLKYHEYQGPLALQENIRAMSGVTPEFKDSVLTFQSRIEQQVQEAMDAMSDEALQAQGICPPGVPMSETRKMIKELMVEDYMNEHGMGGNRLDVLEKEIEWYKEMNCFYPPGELDNKHPEFVALRRQAVKQETGVGYPNRDKRFVYVVRILFYLLASFYEPGVVRVPRVA